eukprot:Rmarinus@m.26173
MKRCQVIGLLLLALLGCAMVAEAVRRDDKDLKKQIKAVKRRLREVDEQLDVNPKDYKLKHQKRQLTEEKEALELKLEEWSTWKKKSGFDVKDRESQARGKTMACGYCHGIVRAAQVLVSERVPEQKLMKFLTESCDHIGNKLPVSGEYVYPGDQKRLCEEVLRNHGEEMIDAISVGEDPDFVCYDVGLCPKGFVWPPPGMEDTDAPKEEL